MMICCCGVTHACAAAPVTVWTDSHRSAVDGQRLQAAGGAAQTYSAAEAFRNCATVGVTAVVGPVYVSVDHTGCTAGVLSKPSTCSTRRKTANTNWSIGLKSIGLLGPLMEAVRSNACSSVLMIRPGNAAIFAIGESGPGDSASCC